MTTNTLIDKLNEALGWELRAINMYAHYAANVKGIHRLQLAPMFDGEATESLEHANIVRKSIVKLEGVPVTERNPHPITHTTNFSEMLQYSLVTEAQAAAVYGEVMIQLGAAEDQDLKDAIEQIYLAELRSVEELRLLME